MANNGKDTTRNRHIEIIVYFLNDNEKFKVHKIDWYGGGLQLSDIATNNDVDNYLNRRIKYIIVRIEK